MRNRYIAALFAPAVAALAFVLVTGNAAPAVVGCPSPSPSASSSASASAVATPSPTPTAQYVLPGSVGYLGAPSALTVYSPGGAAPTGCVWRSYGLRCDDDNVTLDHVRVNGGIYWTGVGTLKVTNSIVQGGTGSEWYAILGHPASSGALPGSQIVVENSTVGWLPGKVYPAGFDVAPVESLYGNQPLNLERDDFSGMPQGIDPTGGSVILANWVHGLVQNHTSSGGVTHLDGLFDQNSGGMLITANYIDAPVRSDVTAALFIQDLGSTDAGIRIDGNYLSGGAYTLRNQTGVNVEVLNNTFGGNLYGFVSNEGGTYGNWAGNVDTHGNVIPKP